MNILSTILPNTDSALTKYAKPGRLNEFDMRPRPVKVTS